jgi:hypothetical protein
MSAINLSSFGDTIYVANGIYEEQVIMIPGLSLIGAGMDSCLIDASSITENSVLINDSCLLEGFSVISSLNKWCVYDSGSTGSQITLNHFKNNSRYGGGIDVLSLNTNNNSNIYIYKNLFNDITIGCDLFNSDALIRGNTIFVYPNSQASIITGIYLGAYSFNYHPLIDSNYIETERTGIKKSYGTIPTISNNEIILKGVGGDGIYLGGPSDSAKVFNNKIYAVHGMEGIYAPDVHYPLLYNNYVSGNFDDQQNLQYVITLESDQTAINNVVTNAERGIKAETSENLVFKYNDVWNNGDNYSGFTPDSTNLSVNPMVINEDTVNNGPDFHLQAYSPLIDRGDPNILDKDGSRSDIGLYGGPFGESYKYLDLPPGTPVNFTAILDSEYIKLTWNRNTEADFGNYNLYRDTMQGFTVDSSSLVASLKDTFYIQIIPSGIDNFYFRVTAVDNQGNESEPSEERHIEIVSVKDRPKIFSSYQLYQNYPNPFNPSTKIGYRLKERGYVKLYVYDIKGELVETLVNKYQDKGFYEVEFNAEVRGQRSVATKLASGVYIYQLMVKNEYNIPVFSDIKKMILLK